MKLKFFVLGQLGQTYEREYNSYKLSLKYFFYVLCLASMVNNRLTAENRYPLDQIHKWADVLNIEGGTIPKGLRQDQKWFDVATILDRPYLDKLEFASMERDKRFDFKETDIETYNELQNYFVHVTLIKYCIDNAHHISSKKIMRL